MCSSECHSCHIYIMNAKYGIQLYYVLYFTIGDELEGRIFLLVGCHSTVNILYYYCHNMILVNKLACLLALPDFCLLPKICDMEVLCAVLSAILVTLQYLHLPYLPYSTVQYIRT